MVDRSLRNSRLGLVDCRQGVASGSGCLFSLCVCPVLVLWTLPARVWRAADGTARATRNSACVCSPDERSAGAGPARGRDVPADTRTHPRAPVGLRFDAWCLIQRAETIIFVMQHVNE